MCVTPQQAMLRETFEVTHQLWVLDTSDDALRHEDQAADMLVISGLFVREQQSVQ